MDPSKKAKQLMDDAAPPGAENREPKYSVAVLDAQFRALQSREVVETAELEGREQRKLEGPVEEAA